MLPRLSLSGSAAMGNDTRKIEEVMGSSSPVAINGQLTSHLGGLSAHLWETQQLASLKPAYIWWDSAHHFLWLPVFSLQDLKSKRNPRLVPYVLLDERTKKSNRDSLREAIRTLIGYGYNIEPSDQEGGQSDLWMYAYQNAQLFKLYSTNTNGVMLW